MLEVSIARPRGVNENRNKFLVDQGIPSERLAATGFGEFQPLDSGDNDEAFARNRRIELKLDQR
jgi:chemotaxis protein MotB